MRKLLWASALVLSFLLTAPSAANDSHSEDTAATYRWWMEPQEVQDDCRVQCSEEGTDPDECQMDCNSYS